MARLDSRMTPQGPAGFATGNIAPVQLRTGGQPNQAAHVGELMPRTGGQLPAQGFAPGYGQPMHGAQPPVMNRPVGLPPMSAQGPLGAPAIRGAYGLPPEWLASLYGRRTGF